MPTYKYNSIPEIDIEHDAIDEYSECIMACAISDEGVQCVTRCIESHIKKEAEQ